MITIPLPGRLIRDADAWQPDGPTTAHQIFHHGNAFAARWPRRFRCSVVTQYRVAWVAWSTVSQCICFLRKWEHFPLAHVGRHREALDSAWLELQQQTWIWHVLLQRFSGLAVTAGFCVTILCSNLLSKKGKAASQVSYWFLQYSYWYSLERDEQSLQYSQCQWELFWRKPVHWESESGHQRGCKTTFFKRTRISCPWSQWSVILPKNRHTSRKFRNFTSMSISSVKHERYEEGGLLLHFLQTLTWTYIKVH